MSNERRAADGNRSITEEKEGLPRMDYFRGVIGRWSAYRAGDDSPFAGDLGLGQYRRPHPPDWTLRLRRDPAQPLAVVVLQRTQTRFSIRITVHDLSYRAN